MHSNVLLGTTLAAVALAYTFKPRKPKTKLEANSTPVPVARTYLPFQLDGVFHYVMSTLSGNEMEYFGSLSRQLGNTFNFRNFNQDLIIVLDPASVQHILAKNQPNYEKGPETNAIFHEFLGSGIFNADGEVWKTQRQLARPHFQTSEFKDVALINGHVDTLIKVLDKTLAAHPGKPLEIQSIFTRFTLDEATEFLFGETVHSLEDENSGFASSFNYAQSITAWRFRVSLWRYLVPTRRFLQEIKKLDDFVYKIIDNAIKRREEKLDKNPAGANDEKEGHANLLDHFLAAQQDHDFTRKYLRDMLLNFLLAGRDTTASLLSWTMWYLSQHPDVVEKLKQEILDVVGPTAVPGYEDIKKLKYQKQVVNEVLRLCPPVPANIRQSVEEDILPNGYYIPAGTPVSYSAYCTHRLPELWGEDVLEFNPDRWGPERVGSIKPFMFVPFHAGPRICLGQNLAYITAQVTLTRLLQHYDIKAVPGFRPQYCDNLVMFSGNGMEVILEKKSLADV
ncbi:cytochrome P450 [Mortierella sp. GBAus27b]|nr:cytochrome P450 [Mortierella sp. GBAus27b]